MDRRALLGKALLALLAEFAVFAVALFVSAGTLLWPAGWAFMALFFGFALATVLYLAREDPELLAERISPRYRAGNRSGIGCSWLRCCRSSSPGWSWGPWTP